MVDALRPDPLPASFLTVPDDETPPDHLEGPPSPLPPIRAARGLEPGHNVWRTEAGTDARLIVDAADYFTVVREAMMMAKQRIMLIGWDFDARVRIGASRNPLGAPPRIGRFVLWLVDQNPELEVFLLRWDFGALKALFRGTTPITVARWALHPRIHVRLDSAHPFGASHHQKIVVIDDCFAFCGGIDITSERWDTRAHLDDEPRRVGPMGIQSYGPWHDATMALAGPAAKALDELARDRWQIAGGDPLPELNRTDHCWPSSLGEPQFPNAAVALARSRPEWDGLPEILEIEELYIDMIARARRHIYIEGQYFASGLIAEAIARRMGEEDPPEIVLVSPQHAHGWLEQVAMDTARARLVEAVRAYDPKGRFRIYIPFTTGGLPIYVHAKIMIVDDEILRVGSSNLNNRSLRLDTECDVVIDAALPENAESRATILAIRDDLIAEHIGCTAAQVTAAIEETGSMIAAIDRLSGNGPKLQPYEAPELGSVGTFLAEHELLDPEGPERTFEPLARRNLFRRLRRPPEK